MNKLKKIIGILNSNEKKKALYLLCLITVLAFLDMLGIASIMPFIGILLNPEFIISNKIVFTLFEFSKEIGVTNTKDFTFLFGILVFALLVITLVVRTLVNYFQIRFTIMCEYRIGKNLIENYLRQPYSWFLNQHSANLGKSIFSEVTQVMNYGVNPVIILISQLILISTIVTLLLLINPVIALLTLSVLSLSYGLIYFGFKNLLLQAGIERAKSNKDRFVALSESFGAIKEIKLGGLEETFISRFSNSALKLYQRDIWVQTISQLPRYIIEGIAFGGMIILILVLMSKDLTFNNYIPLIALYAFAGYRLLPALQQIYAALTNLKSVGPPLETLHKDLKNLKSFKIISNTSEVMKFEKSIKLKKINFKYPFAEKKALKDINLEIKALSKVGIVGITGGGKTTTVDIILGLLEAETGSVEVDGIKITNENKRSWQKGIGYVPQSIYLTDTSISSNIAFGEKKENINFENVKKASKIANIHDFIINELPEGYDTKIGERGIRLSGGQRQRLGIARALYERPQLIIFDEATSALDNTTEKAVMDAIKNLNNEATIIVIAHRLSTVKDCDNIFYFESGELKKQGDINSLKFLSKNFNNMVSDNKLI